VLTHIKDNLNILTLAVRIQSVPLLLNLRLNNKKKQRQGYGHTGFQGHYFYLMPGRSDWGRAGDSTITYY